MKKHLLKAALICLGITLLCGLYSFKTSEGVKSQQNYQTASIVYDTIITPEGEESECIKEVVIESDQSDCQCSLYVSINTTINRWDLMISKSLSCSGPVTARYKYKVTYYANGSNYPNDTTIDYGPYTTIVWNPNSVAHGDIRYSECTPIDLEVCFTP